MLEGAYVSSSEASRISGLCPNGMQKLVRAGKAPGGRSPTAGFSSGASWRKWRRPIFPGEAGLGESANTRGEGNHESNTLYQGFH